MGFTEEQMRACVLDGGTRFVAPGHVTYDEQYGIISKVSDERKEVKDEDMRRVLSALGDAVEPRKLLLRLLIERLLPLQRCVIPRNGQLTRE